MLSPTMFIYSAPTSDASREMAQNGKALSPNSLQNNVVGFLFKNEACGKAEASS